MYVYTTNKIKLQEFISPVQDILCHFLYETEMITKVMFNVSLIQQPMKSSIYKPLPSPVKKRMQSYEVELASP
jgi:hypothetical protein